MKKQRAIPRREGEVERTIYECKSLNNRNFIIAFYRKFCVLFFYIDPLLPNTLGPPVHKLADAL